MKTARSRAGWLPALVVWGALLGCGSTGAPAPAAKPVAEDPPAAQARSLAREVQTLFADHGCMMCHAGTQAEAELNLQGAGFSASLVGRRSIQAPLLLVEPGQPERSYLLHKLQGTHRAVGGEGDVMPDDETPLPAEDLGLVRRWIEAGATGS